MKFFVLLTTTLLFIIACQTSPQQKAQGAWITGNEKEKLTIIEQQFRGFDQAMVETGYRYQELYWAAQDNNWEYAHYQLTKLKLAIKNGLQRRPKRASSAQHFLKSVLPVVEQAIVSKDTILFEKKFQMLTNNCNNCHAMEKVSFFNVQPPIYRTSPIRK